MSYDEPPELPGGLSPLGSLPGDQPQPNPEELDLLRTRKSDENQRLRGFIDFDEVSELGRTQKVKLVQNICERFVYGHLSGMNGTIGYSDTLRPEVKNRDLVSKYRQVATHLWGQGSQLPLQMDDEDLETLLHIGSTDHEGNRSFFENIIRPPKSEPNPKNPYLSQDAFVYHDARMLDYLIKELYIKPNKSIVGFSKN